LPPKKHLTRRQKATRKNYKLDTFRNQLIARNDTRRIADSKRNTKRRIPKEKQGWVNPNKKTSRSKREVVFSPPSGGTDKAKTQRWNWEERGLSVTTVGSSR